MSHLLRSETMGYFNFAIPRESAWDILNAVGISSTLHFVDQESGIPQVAREFAPYAKRCDEVLVKLGVIAQQCINFNKPIKHCYDVPALIQKDFSSIQQSYPNVSGQIIFETLEREISEKFIKLREELVNYNQLCEKMNYKNEDLQIMEIAVRKIGLDFFTSSQQQDNQITDQPDLENNKKFKRSKLRHFVGDILKSDSLRFKRMIFRASQGNCWTEFIDYKQENLIYTAGQAQASTCDKIIFVVISPGIGMKNFESKVIKICDSFDAHMVSLPESQQEYNQQVEELKDQLHDIHNVVKNTEQIIKSQLKDFSVIRKNGTCSYVDVLKYYIRKEKSIYHTMNQFKTRGKQIFTGTVWCPLAEEYNLLRVLQNIHQKDINVGNAELTGSTVPPSLSPPSQFRTNSFTWPFQQIVDTYGVPRYKEVNPGLFTIITFPFLYGVMYGDMGHGFILLLLGIYLCLFSKSLGNKENGSSFGVAVPVRYLLLLMGFFAFYCGFLYNDFMAISLNFFGSCYDPITANETPTGKLPVAKAESCNYPFGMDPIWKQTTNELIFVNSFKMKLAVILGVAQMSFGIFLKGLNALHYKSKTDFFFEFVPQIIFMVTTFAYMDFMIIYKWASDWTQFTRQAPALLNTMINLLIKMGAVCINPGDMPLYGNCEDDLQHKINFYFLVTAVVMIPLMLIPKPLILNAMANSKKNKGYKKIQNQEYENQNEQPLLQGQIQEDDQQNSQPDSSDHEKHDFGEIMVHQMIETIEFVLGSISNTASYLRLWALSLAHSQLASVFLQKGMMSSINSGSTIGLVIGFYVFAILTFGVLMCMDIMECFLHALRLHWVEFQNKFFKADGYKYVPFSFKNDMEEYIAENQS